MRTKIVLLHALLFAASIGCGASNTTTSTTVSEPAAVVSVVPLSFDMVWHVDIAADGAVTFNQEAVGTLGTDGRLVAPDGSVIATLAADGLVTFANGERTARFVDAHLEGASASDAEHFLIEGDVLVINDQRLAITGFQPGSEREVLFIALIATRAAIANMITQQPVVD